MPSLNEIRRTFLDYFGNRDHEIVSSSPLVPRNDPSLMFTNSGMVQFKNLFSGIEQRNYCRATTSQKCVRAGGKHNDLENVGYTARHHTFFEMLGNFSFGDYFKEQAIWYCWDLITREFQINESQLLVTVYHDDDEAIGYWKSIAGLPDSRIIRIATSDNFWSMGDTGPCGPCTELYYDYGEGIPGGPPGSADEDGNRFVEIWNLVFMQFEQFANGTRSNLPKPSIDTGMGLERIGALLQGTFDNYETNLFKSLIEASAAATNTEPYGRGNVHHRVIADHLRSAAFLIAEGVLPSNDGRGYVLRRILRRAMRHANLLGSNDPVIFKLVPTLVQQMGQAFPELARSQPLISDTLLNEEARFQLTLERGLRILEEEIKGLSTGGCLSGGLAFKLYDTYGFPLDLTQDALRDRGLSVDTVGFDTEMAEQKRRARAHWSGYGVAEDESTWFEISDRVGSTEFLGYHTDTAQAVILAIVKDGEELNECKKGDEVHIVVNQTPFYAESGGQVGDTGKISTDQGTAQVVDTRSVAGVCIHRCQIAVGTVRRSDDAVLAIDGTRRQNIRLNHSATHLLNESLRQHLGGHVAQKGSLNDENRLRFDFSHSKTLDLPQIASIEKTVNRYIRQNSRVETRIMDLEDARSLGAQALFGEKYDDEVRVVSMGIKEEGPGCRPKGTFSIELCGGTHVNRTGDIGLFVIIGESASSAGVRRIEALTGDNAFQYLSEQDHLVAELSLHLKTNRKELKDRILKLARDERSLKFELRKQRAQNLISDQAGSESRIQEPIDGGILVGAMFDGISPGELPAIVDKEKDRIKSGVVVLVTRQDKKSSIVVGVTGDLTSKYSAIDIVRNLTPCVGGSGGGGRPDFARGGGPHANGGSTVLKTTRKILGIQE